MVTRILTEIPASEIEPGDFIVLEKTSGGIRLTNEGTLVLDVREHMHYRDDEEIPRTWLRLDTAGMLGIGGLRPSSTLGTFLSPDEKVEVYR